MVVVGVVSVKTEQGRKGQDRMDGVTEEDGRRSWKEDLVVSGRTGTHHMNTRFDAFLHTWRRDSLAFSFSCATT